MTSAAPDMTELEAYRILTMASAFSSVASATMRLAIATAAASASAMSISRVIGSGCSLLIGVNARLDRHHAKHRDHDGQTSAAHFGGIKLNADENPFVVSLARK